MLFCAAGCSHRPDDAGKELSPSTPPAEISVRGPSVKPPRGRSQRWDLPGIRGPDLGPAARGRPQARYRDHSLPPARRRGSLLHRHRQMDAEPVRGGCGKVEPHQCLQVSPGDRGKYLSFVGLFVICEYFFFRNPFLQPEGENCWIKVNLFRREVFIEISWVRDKL